MFDRRFFLKYWLPVLAWMTFIYMGSTDLLSSARTGRFLISLVRWLYPRVSAEILQWIHFVVRKGGHLTEYAILALLLWRTLMHLRPEEAGHPRPGLRAWQAWLFATAYAATDELHQTLYRSRTGSASDVLIDAIGAASGLVLVWAIGCWRKWW
jgi:VanZ family protein